MRRAAKRDIAEPDIVTALEKIGAKVYRNLPVDLLVFHRNRFICLEVKTPGRSDHKAERKAQNAFIAETTCRVVKSPQEAIEAITRSNS
jgi:hypothetical protein